MGPIPEAGLSIPRRAYRLSRAVPAALLAAFFFRTASWHGPASGPENQALKSRPSLEYMVELDSVHPFLIVSWQDRAAVGEDRAAVGEDRAAVGEDRAAVGEDHALKSRPSLEYMVELVSVQPFLFLIVRNRCTYDRGLGFRGFGFWVLGFGV
ncbi:hypothetical protein T484DRAFT_3543096 [Baffinella frigidus]|nr:hypothetical protein T484DRAFT_3543096 [Cryptophyta sp. CCMP2293]